MAVKWTDQWQAASLGERISMVERQAVHLDGMIELLATSDSEALCRAVLRDMRFAHDLGLELVLERIARGDYVAARALLNVSPDPKDWIAVLEATSVAASSVGEYSRIVSALAFMQRHIPDDTWEVVFSHKVSARVVERIVQDHTLPSEILLSLCARQRPDGSWVARRGAPQGLCRMISQTSVDALVTRMAVAALGVQGETAPARHFILAAPWTQFPLDDPRRAGLELLAVELLESVGPDDPFALVYRYVTRCDSVGAEAFAATLPDVLPGDPLDRQLLVARASWLLDRTDLILPQALAKIVGWGDPGLCSLALAGFADQLSADMQHHVEALATAEVTVTAQLDQLTRIVERLRATAIDAADLAILEQALERGRAEIEVATPSPESTSSPTLQHLLD